MENEKSVLLKRLHYQRKNNDKKGESESLLELAKKEYEEEDYNKAKLHLEESEKINSNTPFLHYYLSLIYLNKGNKKEAIKNLKKEIKINPSNESVKKLYNSLYIDTNLPVITIAIFLLNCIVFLFTFPEINFLQTLKFSLHESTLLSGSLITSLFFHANTIHFATNMLILIMFGLILEKYIGSLKFLLIYLAGGIIGNVAEVILSGDGYVLGASSALFAIVGSLLMHYPFMELKLFGVVKVPLILAFGGFFAISSIVSEFVIPASFSYAQLAHLGGFLGGMLLTAILYRSTIFVFYSWSLIFIGFWILSFVVERLISVGASISISDALIFTIISAVSLSIIGFSYDLLKQSPMGGEEE